MSLVADIVNATANEFDTTVNYRGRLTTVRLTSLSKGFSSTGHALCDYEDEYSAEFGFALAYARALHRLIGKDIKRLSKGAEDIVEAINSGQSI